jgi:uncharacterized protein (TIGR00730 family)
MAVLRRVCVFCGSKHGARPEYTEAARAMGAALAAGGIGLVYGGGSIGLMGVVADAVLDAGGEVIGVIPDHMSDREIAHYGLTDLRVVGSMHERKALMYELSDGFVALPGGLGTLEELFEIWTARTLGLHDKPIVVLDPDGLFEQLRAQLDTLVALHFARPEVLEAIVWTSTAADAVRLAEGSGHRPPPDEGELLEAEP